MKGWKLYLATLTFITLTTLAFAQTQDDESSIRDLATQWQDAYNAGDMQAVAELYTDDAWFSGFEGMTNTGREAILAYLQNPEPLPLGEGQITITTDDLQITGDTAYGHGTYTLSGPDGSEVARGNYLVVDKKVNGEWKIQRHIANADLSMMQGAQAEGEAMQGDIRSEIEAANREFMDAFSQGDAQRLASFYTENGQVLPPNGDTVTGHEALVSFWQGVMDAGIKEAQLEIDEVERFGDTAYEVSRATLSGADGQVLDRVKYIVVWKQQDGQWKLHRDIFNSSLPPAGQ